MTEESRRFGAIGGKTRAAKLTKEERREAAKRAAAARWGAELPVAEYPGVLRLAGREIPCAVLSDGTRVLTQAELLEALGRHRKANVRSVEGEEPPPPVLQGEALRPFIDKELLRKSQPIKFRTLQGALANGYRAEILVDICDVYIKADAAGKLQRQQKHIAEQARILKDGLATVGIIALVDAATGFEKKRPREALAEILEAFVQKELRKWVRTFPAEYYEHLCRLRDVPYPPENMKLPQYFGTLTNNIVYDRLAPGVKDELKRVTPRTSSGRPRDKLFRRLTEDVGHPKLREHLAAVVTLMKISPDYDTFMGHLNKALRRWDDSLELGLND